MFIFHDLSGLFLIKSLSNKADLHIHLLSAARDLRKCLSFPGRYGLSPAVPEGFLAYTGLKCCNRLVEFPGPRPDYYSKIFQAWKS